MNSLQNWIGTYYEQIDFLGRRWGLGGDCSDIVALTRPNYIESIMALKKEEVTKKLIANIILKGKEVISKENMTTKVVEPTEKEPLTFHLGDDKRLLLLILKTEMLQRMHCCWK